MILPLANQAPIGPIAEPQRSMHGRYRINHPLKLMAMRFMDALLTAIPRRRTVVSEVPQRILVSNWAHLGDVITSFGALRALRDRYPEAQIGMIVGSWGKAAIERTGLVDDIHVIDHWALNRSGLSKWAKHAQYRRTRASALRDIRAIGYQAAIDLFAVFPPAHPLFFRAKIPIRIGYISSGFGPLLTHPVRWNDEERPMADQYRDLIDRFDPTHPFAPALFKPYRDRSTLAPLPSDVAGAGRYIVIHPGAGSPTRHWGLERWRALIAHLIADAGNYRLVLTGAGSDDVAIATDLAQFSGTINMAGRASWEEFVRIVADAALVICPDTATGHVAALFEVPTIVIFTGTNSAVKWGPYNDRAQILTRPVLCAPCNTRGCSAMACFLGVTPNDVADAVGVALAGLPAPHESGGAISR